MDIGSTLPDRMVQQLHDGEIRQINLAQEGQGKTLVVIGLPGAFTPTCSNDHVPGFVAEAPSFIQKGVDAIYIVTPTDFFVVDAWSKTYRPDEAVQFVADGNLDFTKAAGQELDLSAIGLGNRSQRYAAVVRDGKVANMFVEPDATQVTVSGAENVLASL